MTGPIRSVIGIPVENSISGFLGGVRRPHQPAPGPCAMRGVLYTLDSATGRCTQIERIDVR